MATDVVGAITALMAIARPRPRLIGPLPRSIGFDQFSRAVIRSRMASSGASTTGVPVACGTPLRRMFFLRNATGSILSARATMSVWLS